MRPYALVRLAVALLQLAVVVIGVFALTSILPGDTAVVILGEHPGAGQLAALRAQLGLHDPIWQRFQEWAGGVLLGDLGSSLLTGEPVAEHIAQRCATTILLAMLALAVVIPLAVLIGVLCGLQEGTRVDRVLSGTVVVLDSIPEFALGLLLVGAFSLHAGLLPATGAGSSGFSLLSEPSVLVLPIAVLVSKQLCALARQVRIGIAEANHADYATHARLLGRTERAVLIRHVFPNACGPVVQQLARSVDGLLGGVVIVEALFALPGLGSGFVDAVRARDLPTVQGYALVFASTTILVNLLADLASRALVPATREVGR